MKKSKLIKKIAKKLGVKVKDIRIGDYKIEDLKGYPTPQAWDNIGAMLGLKPGQGKSAILSDDEGQSVDLAAMQATYDLVNERRENERADDDWNMGFGRDARDREIMAELSELGLAYDPTREVRIASIVPVKRREAVDKIVDAPISSKDGRSPWFWVRLANGDLMLGIFPRGDVYMNTEQESERP